MDKLPEQLVPVNSGQQRSRDTNTTNVAPPSELLMKAVALHQEGRLDEAETLYRALLQGNPRDCHALHYLGLIALQNGRYEEAADLIGRAIAVDPRIPSFHCNLGNAYNSLGLYESAIAAYLEAVKLDPAFLAAQVNLGNAYRELKRRPEAIASYQKALAIDPNYLAARVNLAMVLTSEGRHDEARRHRDLAYGRQSLFVSRSATAKRTVLLLCDASQGNVPLNFLFPLKTNNHVEWMVEYASESQYPLLPPYDVVFNAIGDPDAKGVAAEFLVQFAKTCKKPLLNPPDRIVLTARNLMPQLLEGIENIVVPPVWRIEQKGAWFDNPGFGFPVLVRPLMSQGGEGLKRVDSRDELAAMKRDEAGVVHLCNYYDYQSPDGYYRKYRMIFVDREPYPYHLAISKNWMVHYLSADMPAHPWKLSEEMAYLQDPESALGAKAMQAVREIAQRVNLDYAGMDFSVLPDGRLLIFEVNATMLVHPERAVDALLPKNPHIQRIFDAFEAMLARAVQNAH